VDVDEEDLAVDVVEVVVVAAMAAAAEAAVVVDTVAAVALVALVGGVVVDMEEVATSAVAMAKKNSLPIKYSFSVSFRYSQLMYL